MLIISLTLIAKIILSLFVSGFIFMFFVWPVNEKPTSKTQITFGILAVSVYLSWMFDLIKFSVN